MGKASLFVVIFLVFAIILSISGIFLLDHIKPSPTNAPSTQTQTQPVSVTSDDGSTLFVTADLKNVSEKNGSVYADITVPNNGKNSNIKTLLFDGKIYPAYYLNLPPDSGSDQPKVEPYFNSSDVYSQTKKLENSKVELYFELTSKRPELNCNKILRNFLNGSAKNVPCIPVVVQLSVHVT